MKPTKLMRALVLLILPCVLVVSGCDGTTNAGSSGVDGFSISEQKVYCFRNETGGYVPTTIKVTGKIKNNSGKRAKVNLEVSLLDNSDASNSRLLWTGSFWEPTDSYIASGASKNFIKVFTKPPAFHNSVCVPVTHHTLKVTDVENA